MAGLHLHTSNRLENLFADLAGIVGQSSGTIFQPEVIVVQSVGMGRWLSLRLAETHGICANVQFPFPQKFVSTIFNDALPDLPVAPAFEREVLLWRIMRLLPALSQRAGFEPVQSYLGGEQPELKLYQLASRIAEVFDRYLAFRPEMILEWDQGEGEEWQAILWRELSREFPQTHQPALGLRLTKILKSGHKLRNLPPRASIFGLSTLPPFYLRIIEAIATQADIHLFVMEPTPEWWQQIVSPRERSRILKKKPAQTDAELHLDAGNTLLASMGMLGRDFLGLITDLEPATYHESFVTPDGETLLAKVQRDIYQLRNHPTPIAISPNDKSIQFHSCHGPMREIEVLHDQLLDAFARHPDLQPNDIVVMMPNVAVYAPFIEAVFSTPENESLRIPFTIADRTARVESGVIDTFLGLLDLSHGRFGAGSVLNVLESPAIQERFGLAESDLETIRVWIDKAAIRWGIDADHRAEFDLPAFSENSWRQGLDRLLLGYALPAGGAQLFHGILPVDEIEGSLAETLGNFVEFTEALFEMAKNLKRERSLSEWQRVLRELVARFFAPSPRVERELFRVRDVLDSLGTIAAAADFAGDISFDVLLAHLQRTLGEAGSGTGFIAGRVTFCALKPMRSIPFRVVCLVGMNDTDYPRKSSPANFDLIAAHPEPGDRNTRDDDRYLFLEALLSARESFYLSYVGQSARDNSALPPSVLVSELLDYLGGEETAQGLATKHKLQAFNPAYFEADSALFSYSRENCRASEAAIEPTVEPPPFFAGQLLKFDEEERAVTLDNLLRFYRNPAKFFLQNRLGLTLPNEHKILEEREPFEPGNLDRYKIEQTLLAGELAGQSSPANAPLVQAGGRLPPGLAGERSFREIVRRVQSFVDRVKDELSPSLPARSIDLSINDWRLTGQIDCLTDNGSFGFRLTNIKPQDLLRTWIFHLALNSGSPIGSQFVANDAAIRFPAITDPELCLRYLGELLEIYGWGYKEPVPFFPRSSLAFARQTLKPAGNKPPREKSLEQWNGNRDDNFAEKDDPYLALAFRNVPEPLNDSWEALALEVFRPLLQECETFEYKN